MVKAAGCPVHGLAISPSSTTIYSGDHTGVLRLHDLPTCQLISEFPGGAGKCRVIRVQKSEAIATGGQDGVIRLWDCRKKRCVSALKNHSGGIVDLQFSVDKKHLLVASKDGSLKQWDLSTLRNPETVSSSEPISQLSLTPTQAATLHNSGVLKLWDLRTFEMVSSTQTVEGHCFGVESGSGRVSYVCGRKSFQVYRLDTGVQTCAHKVKWKTPMVCRELSQIYCVCADSAVISLWGVHKPLLVVDPPQGYAWEQIVSQT